MDTQTGDAQEFVLTDIESTEAFLTENNIEFCTLRHEITPTNEKMKEVVKFTGESFIDTVLAKQIFLWNRKKKDGDLFLVVAGVDTEIDLKALNKYLPGVSSGNLSYCDDECL